MLFESALATCCKGGRKAKSESLVQELLPPGIRWTERYYSPLTTLLVFLWQCLAKSSCREAVAKRVAQCVAARQQPCSYATGAYCVARTRLPENLVKGLARQVGLGLHKKALEAWLWKGRKVKVVDGSTVSMPDTVKNQEAYPQGANQKAGVGFPIARILVIFSLAVGTALELAICPCKGKWQSELAMVRHDTHSSAVRLDLISRRAKNGCSDRRFTVPVPIATYNRLGTTRHNNDGGAVEKEGA